MSDSTDLIRELADKLGTTTEKLWPHLLHYCYINGIIHLAVCGLIAALSAWAFIVVLRSAKKNWKVWSWNDSAHEGAIAGLFLISLVFVVVVAVGLPDALMDIYATDGSVLVWLIHQVKK